jgi:hypothetical protein
MIMSMDTPEPEQELSAAELERAEPFQKLREEMHRISDKETEERIRINPVPTEEEILAGAFREMIEPQVRNAVFDMRRKGYATQSSGFGEDGKLQAIDGYFQIDEKTEEKLRAIGVNVKRGVDTGTSASDEYAIISFHPDAPDVSKIEDKWGQIVALLSEQEQPASPSLSGGHEDFRNRFAPGRTDVERAAIKKNLKVEQFSPEMEKQMRDRLNEIDSNKT